MSNGRCFSCGQFHATAHSLTEKMAELTAERDSLAASLEATKPCEPCQRDDHDNCTGYCSSMCCALAAAERERDSLAASLEAVREIVANVLAFSEDQPYAGCGFILDDLQKLSAVLSAPTDKGDER